MKLRSLLLLVLFAVLVAGCGGGGKKAGTSTTGSTASGTTTTGSKTLQPGDIAVVGTDHISQADFATALSEEKASLKDQGQTVPAAGSTTYTQMKTGIVERLVQEAIFAQEAQKLGISVSAAEYTKAFNAFKKQYGSKYEADIKAQGFTDAEIQQYVREQTLETKLYDEVTKGAKATTAEIEAYYAENISTYQTPASRKVEEILVGKNKKALAEQIYSELQAGKATFAALAKKYSQDPGSKDKGGKFTANQGSDVPEFDAAVFAKTAKTGVLLKPVNTSEYGWFVIEPLSAITPKKTTAESKAAPAIRKQLDSQKKQAVASAWLTKTEKTYCSADEITFASAYAPSPGLCATVTTSVPTTT
jgi:foldase protein PrsA